MPRKDSVIHDLPLPPIPKFLLPKDDVEYQKAEPMKPEDFRAKVQLVAVEALEIMQWHAQNLGDPKSSIAASQDLMDRAGYVAPARAKAETPPASGEVGTPLAPVEDQVRELSEDFAGINASPVAGEDE